MCDVIYGLILLLEWSRGRRTGVVRQIKVMKTNSFLLWAAVLAVVSVIAKSSAAPRPPQPPWPEATLRIYGFDSAYQRGPWKMDAAINEETSVVDSWSGQALVREGFSSLSPVVIPVDVESKRPNYKLDGGAVRFWIAPNWSTASEKLGGKGPGHLAHLLELVSLDAKKPEVKWSLCVNDAGDTIYLAGEGKGGVTVYLKAPIQFEAGDWRMITLGYSTTNTALWVDNELVAKGDGLPMSAWWETKNLGLVVGSDIYGSGDSVAEAQFEELAALPRWPSNTKWQAMHYTAVKHRTLLGPVGTKEEEQAKVAVLKGSGLLPEEYGSMAKLSGEGDGPIILYSYAAGTLWLEITGVSNNLAHLIVHGTTPDVAYEILSKESLTNTEWVGEQVIIGAAGQDWTPTTATVGTRTNNLFFWARTLVDSDGDGLPDWWEQAHGLDPNNPDTGNAGISDGYKDSDNDGWTNLQEYQNRTNPGGFNAPAAPQAFVVTTDATGTHPKLSWSPANGPVTGYTIQRESDNSLVSLGSSVGSFVDSSTALPTGLYYDEDIPNFRMRAEYAGGSSGWSQWHNVADLNAPNSQLLPGQNEGRVIVATMPNNTAYVRVGLAEFDYGLNEFVSVAHVDLAPNQFTNGVGQLPSPFVHAADSNYWQYTHFVLSNSVNSAANFNFYSTRVKSFWDGRAQLKDNLRFLLRAATPYTSFGFTRLPSGPGSSDYAFSPTDYAYASFYDVFESSGFLYAYSNPFRPFYENYLYRNFTFSDTNLDYDGSINTGAFWNYGLFLLTPEQYTFTAPINQGSIASVLGLGATTWTAWSRDNLWYQTPAVENSANLGLGITETWDQNLGYHYSMSSGARNWFGLQYQSVKFAWGSNSANTATLQPGNGFYHNDGGYFYPQTAAPQFQVADYYFDRILFGPITASPLPGHPFFSVTNTTPLLITSVGDPGFTLAGYAKLAVTNGYSGVYGYLGQYFDKAYKTTNGVVTTNETGILSPYGEFFPTEPGRTALVTMPDLDTGARGTATVYVVKMELDVNHDGVIDRTFAGPDNTSVSKPFRFWINNDNDASTYSDGYEINAPGNADSRDNEIKSHRDLEDFARLWISGMPPLPAGQGYSVTISSSGPGIQLFPAYDSAEGGIGYLTNATAAANQVSSSSRFAWGVVSPNTNYVFPDGYFATYGRKHFLFEGVSAGEGALLLTIAQGTNVLMQHSVFMDLKDVKEMYEQGRAKNVTSELPPSSLVSELVVDRVVNAPADESKQVIVFVHGINNSEFGYQNSTETIFKRLYWSGYQGRVAGFRWPCAYLPAENSANPVEYLKALNYNKSEFYAWKSANAFKLYLESLTNRLVGYQINILAHSQGSVVASETIRQVAPFDNLILAQAAIPAHCYDTSTNVPFLQKFLNAETNIVLPKPTPFYQTNGGYHGYFAGLSGNIVNFFNPQDYALATGTTGPFQTNWEENQRAYKPESFIGGVTYSYNPNTHTTVGSYPFSNYTVTDLQEIKAVVARSRSAAAGAQTGVGGVINTNDSANLQTSYNFGLTRDEHSAQFTRPAQTAKGYYDGILRVINPPTP